MNKIMIVEDVTETVEATTVYFERSNEVTLINDYFRADQVLGEVKFDMIVLDLRLVCDDDTVMEEGGLDLIKKVKGDTASLNYATPFYFLTGQSASLDRSQIKDMPGYLGVIEKTVQHRLRAEVDKYLKAS